MTASCSTAACACPLIRASRGLPHGSTEREFDRLFTTDKPIIFNFHGYPWLIHKFVPFHGANLHVRPAIRPTSREATAQSAAICGRMHGRVGQRANPTVVGAMSMSNEDPGPHPDPELPAGMEHPRGTLAVVIIFGVLFTLGWFAMYFLRFMAADVPHH